MCFKKHGTLQLIGSVAMAAKTKKRGGQSFLQGALILTASMAVVKIIGALFKIPLGWILGPEGFGYLLSPPPASRLLSQEWCRKIWRENGIGMCGRYTGFRFLFS